MKTFRVSSAAFMTLISLSAGAATPAAPPTAINCTANNFGPPPPCPPPLPSAPNPTDTCKRPGSSLTKSAPLTIDYGRISQADLSFSYNTLQGETINIDASGMLYPDSGGSTMASMYLVLTDAKTGVTSRVFADGTEKPATLQMAIGSNGFNSNQVTVVCNFQ